MKVVKRILRYISGTSDLGLWYTKETNTNLVGFSDANCAGDLDDRKSTIGGCFYLGNNLFHGIAVRKIVCHCLLLSLSM